MSPTDNCPYCHRAMNPYNEMHLNVNSCNNCYIILLKKGDEFEFFKTQMSLIALSKPVLCIDGSSGIYLCRLCGNTLKMMAFAGRDYHHCAQCGCFNIPHVALKTIGDALNNSEKSVAPQRAGTTSDKRADGKSMTSLPVSPIQQKTNLLVRNKMIPYLVLFIAFVFGILPRPYFRGMFFSMPIHELGHAVAAWLSGYVSLPTPFGFTFWGPHFPVVIIVVSVVLFGYIMRKLYIDKYYFTLAVVTVPALSFCLLPIYLSFFPNGAFKVFGGVAGEFVLPAIGLSFFALAFPATWRWDFWRFPIGIYLAIAFGASISRWQPVISGNEMLPLGSVMGGEANGGDFGKLISEFGWTEKSALRNVQKVRNYACIFLILFWTICAIKERKGIFRWVKS